MLMSSASCDGIIRRDEFVEDYEQRCETLQEKKGPVAGKLRPFVSLLRDPGDEFRLAQGLPDRRPGHSGLSKAHFISAREDGTADT